MSTTRQTCCEECGITFFYEQRGSRPERRFCSRRCATTRMGKNNKSSVLKRFNAGYTIEPNGCWLWQRHKARRGYGRLWDGEDVAAHRIAFKLFVGPIPDGMLICHRCDTPGCVNPEHLFVGTTADNVADMDRKGRRATGESHPSVRLTTEKVHQIRQSSELGVILAAKLGVHKSAIYAVRQGRSWKWLPR